MHRVLFLACLTYIGLFSAPASSRGTKDITPIGDDTFILARPGRFTTFDGIFAKDVLYSDAMSYCASMGKQFLPEYSRSKDSGYGMRGTAELKFRCLPISAANPEFSKHPQPPPQRLPDMKF